MNMTIKESVLKSIEFIENNLNKDIGVCDVANAVSYSQFYFSREFSKHTHISIYDYILRRKISESYKELLHSESKIIDIALHYGFQSHEVYTRAFRKMFGENPSKVTVDKPLALYEPIDRKYLDFLCGLNVEIMDETIDDYFFEVSAESELNHENSVLILLSQDNLYQCKCIFKGRLLNTSTDYLAYMLTKLKCKIRIYHNNTMLSFRYFTDYIYDIDEMSSNYILVKKMHNYIDIIVPSHSSNYETSVAL